MKIVQPPDWPRPKGYACATAAAGRVISVSGQVGWDSAGRFGSANFTDQAAQALRNIVTILAAAGAGPEHIVRLTWYVIDKQEYLEAQETVGQAYRQILGRHYPAMSVVAVVALMEDHAKVEIEATAIVPGD